MKKIVKISLLGDSSTQLLANSLRAASRETDLELDIWEAGYDQIEQQLLQTQSDFYKTNPHYVLIYHSSHKLLNKFNSLDSEAQQSFAAEHLTLVSRLYDSICSKLNTQIIYYNLTEIDDSVWGNFSNKYQGSFLFQLRKINLELMYFATKKENFHICDLSIIQNQLGKQNFFRTATYVNSDIVINPYYLPIVSSKTIALVSCVLGRFKKCVVIDLDNTIWGGVIGDDGLENIQIGNFGIGKVFSELQSWLKKLKNRGVILAVCSKNDEWVAKKPFMSHPDMVLRLDDIAVFLANWENKVDNIRRIKNILNLNYDSLVFLDDNPAERDVVRTHIQGIEVPELPEDPADYLEFLYNLNLFETNSYTKDDNERTTRYQVELERRALHEASLNEEAYLRSLEMQCVVESLTDYNIPRVAQLSQRSNQFNLRTIRYTEDVLRSRNPRCDRFYLTFSLRDKFGGHGLICVVSLEAESAQTLFIENWFMSCRVLKRGMEYFVLNEVATLAVEQWFSELKGEYIATDKNALVMNHYKDLGFKQAGRFWLLNLNAYETKSCQITKVISFLDAKGN